MNKVIDMNQARQQAQERKSNTEKIIEKHLATGKKLTQSEALTILTEMSTVVSRLELIINNFAMRLQALEYQASSTAASSVALHRMLQEKKGIFTEEDFKEAWELYIKKPLDDAKAEREKAEKEVEAKTTEEITEQVKKDSLEAAQETPSESKPIVSDEQKPDIEASDAPVSET
jgi:hypothetical protein